MRVSLSFAKAASRRSSLTLTQSFQQPSMPGGPCMVPGSEPLLWPPALMKQVPWLQCQFSGLAAFICVFDLGPCLGSDPGPVTIKAELCDFALVRLKSSEGSMLPEKRSCPQTEKRPVIRKNQRDPGRDRDRKHGAGVQVDTLSLRGRRALQSTCK